MEIPEYAGVAQAVVSLDEAVGRGRRPIGLERGDSPEDEEEHSFSDDAHDFGDGDDTDDLDGPEYEYTIEEAYGEREAEAAAWQFNTAARKVNLSGERLRFPAGLTAATKEWIIEVRRRSGSGTRSATRRLTRFRRSSRKGDKMLRLNLDKADTTSGIRSRIENIYDRIAGDDDYQRNENKLRLIQVCVITVVMIS
jgi:hypothetical protein